MSVTHSHVYDEIRRAELEQVYLETLRRRFKDEINRLTSGAMRDLLGNREDAGLLAFPLSYLYAWHWLRHNVHADYHAQLLAPFRGPRFGFLMDLLLSPRPEVFVRGYIAHWRDHEGDGPAQHGQLRELLARCDNDSTRLADEILAAWHGLGLFCNDYLVEFKAVGREERERYEGMLGPADLERLTLVDALPDVNADDAEPVRFTKLGLIPAMGCPQTCRHCMFTWRPPKPKQADRAMLYELVDGLTDSVLFTGGDLTRQLDDFHAAIRSMPHVSTFAILLNGDFAVDRQTTRKVLAEIDSAVRSRPAAWARATVVLQISFDEFHQEVVVNRKGELVERIPVARIANIVECWPEYAANIRLALLHKQTALNFSDAVFREGVFARLARELGRRGHALQVLTMTPSARLKRNPRDDNRLGKVLKEATFILRRHPDMPIIFTSTTIDAYGRAALLEERETVKDREFLHQILTHGPPAGECFDTDLMFWFNGWVTLFNAVHVCMGDIYADGIETVLARWRKDPLSHALYRFDRRLLNFYAELRNDLDERIASATGPHHLFHMLTEEADMRLHMTRRLLQAT